MLKKVGGSVKCWLLTVKKSVAYPEWEDTVLRRYNWLQDKSKKDDGKRKEEGNQKLVT